MQKGFGIYPATALTNYLTLSLSHRHQSTRTFPIIPTPARETPALVLTCIIDLLDGGVVHDRTRRDDEM